MFDDKVCKGANKVRLGGVFVPLVPVKIPFVSPVPLRESPCSLESRRLIIQTRPFETISILLQASDYFTTILGKIY